MTKGPELYSINLAQALSDKNTSALTKLTIMKLKEQQYLTLSEFIQGLSDNDLANLGMQFDKMKDNDSILQDIIILAEVIASGEGDGGFDINDISDNLENLNYFVVTVTCESLKRKGLITLDYSKITFDPAYRSEVIARVIE